MNEVCFGNTGQEDLSDMMLSIFLSKNGVQTKGNGNLPLRYSDKSQHPQCTRSSHNSNQENLPLPEGLKPEGYNKSTSLPIAKMVFPLAYLYQATKRRVGPCERLFYLQSVVAVGLESVSMDGDTLRWPSGFVLEHKEHTLHQYLGETPHSRPQTPEAYPPVLSFSAESLSISGFP